MATSSFFNGSFSAPDKDTVDKIIDNLNAKVSETDAARIAAQAAAANASTSASTTSTNAALTAADRVATAADRVQTGADRTASDASAASALVSKNAASDSAAAALTSKNTAQGIATTFGSVQGAVDSATAQAGIATTGAGTATTQAGIAATQAGIATTQAGLATTNGAAQVTLAANQVTLATTAKTAAEAARDASFVTGPKYATEALGRAAVGDGINFMVQGTGDTAAFEYRRTNSTTSAPIASYPSSAAVQAKQSEILRTTVTLLDFSAYLFTGNIDATTGEISNTTIQARKSIVKYPINGGVTYRILNKADLLSGLRVSWFNASNVLISVTALAVGQMADWTLAPPGGAVTVSLTLKSGNTDGTSYDASLVKFYQSTDSKFDIEKIGVFNIADPVAAAQLALINPSLAKVGNEVFPVSTYSAWAQYGNSSTSGLNANAAQSNSGFIAASAGDAVTSTAAMYRINYFDKDKVFIGQAAIVANDSMGVAYTVPTGLGIEFIRISMLLVYSANTSVVTVNRVKSELSRVASRVAVMELATPSLGTLPASVTALEGRATALESTSVFNVIAGGSAASKAGNSVTLDNSTPSRAGLMSKEDKAKLDAVINGGNITITGSGVTKNAAAYGFLPTNNADQNAAALQAAVLGGGLVLVDLKGVYNLNQTTLLDSFTWLVFGAGVYINKVLYNGKSPRYTFINRGAFTKEYNENIRIDGLNIICNGIGNGNDSTTAIAGMRGHVAFHYIKRLRINDFTLLDGDASSYVIHVCTFTDIRLIDLKIEGYKDAVHLGNGSGFVIRDGYFRTYDDPIALNAHDYASGQPELGWITNGLIENCYDLDDPVRGTTGYFARILAGAWLDWSSGMSIQNSDTVVSNGRMYRAFNSPDGVIYTSTTQPTHTSGTVTLNGINWKMIQETGVTYTVGVSDVTFKNIYLQKPRPVALSIHFDKDNYSRSYYPNAASPVQSNLVFDGIYQQAAITTLISAVTPLKNVKVINSVLGATNINLTNIGTAGIVYGDTNILLLGNTHTATAAAQLVTTASGRTAKFRALGSIKESAAYAPTYSAGVTVLGSDL